MQVVERWILAALRHRTFFSLAELNTEMTRLLERLNTRPFRKLAGSRRSLFEALDGSFPNRESEIDEHTLQPTIPYMPGHDMGIAYDGDADRVALITPGGRVLDAEEISYQILHELLKTRDGDIVANIGCGTTIDFIAKKHGRKVHRVQVGATSMLRFESLDSGSQGPAIDNVQVSSIQAVPEPGTLLILSTGLLGLTAVRRRA